MVEGGVNAAAEQIAGHVGGADQQDKALQDDLRNGRPVDLLVGPAQAPVGASAIGGSLPTTGLPVNALQARVGGAGGGSGVAQGGA